ncbi:hypothetical protein LC612_42875 [Nostoc sp. CHAB 5834]|nr:hypothetical protein [Nostoc sp. CHAB 5834]
MYQNQWNANLVRAEDYLFAKTDLKKSSVVVGSSLSARVPFDDISHLVNLSFGGLSAIDGLQLIHANAQYPVCVYVEVNTLLNGKNESFSSELFSPTRYALKSYFPIFLTRNQPIAILKGLIRYKRVPERLPLADRKVDEKKTDIGQETINQIKVQQRSLLTSASSGSQLEELTRSLRTLEKKGCKIVFFEMPIHPSLCHSVYSATIRKELYKRFPQKTYLYIPQPTCGQFQTTDGIHLTASGADLYADYFKERMAI